MFLFINNLFSQLYIFKADYHFIIILFTLAYYIIECYLLNKLSPLNLDIYE